MRNVKYIALSAGLLLACAGSAQAMGELVLGDSLGVGVKIVSGHAGPARLSQFIRNDQILEQIAQVPNGATAFLVLGTNDSAGSVKGLEKNIDNIVRAVESRKINLVWVGPPCVRKSWDKNSRDLDAMLSARLASTSIKYISIRSDTALCSGAVYRRRRRAYELRRLQPDVEQGTRRRRPADARGQTGAHRLVRRKPAAESRRPTWRRRRATRQSRALTISRARPGARRVPSRNPSRSANFSFCSGATSARPSSRKRDGPGGKQLAAALPCLGCP